MEKKVTFIAFFLCLGLTMSQVFAAVSPKTLGNDHLKVLECNAPPPDSFQVLSRGPNFVTLGWSPAWPGASHTITVLIKDAMGNWLPFNVYYNIPGSSYTINNLAFDADCKFLIATNCFSGEAGNITASLLDKIILEVTMGGRMPINPIPVHCNNILLYNKKWVGFSITGEGSTNLFEFEKIQENGETNIKIKRVVDQNPIVAVDYINRWPNAVYPELTAPNPFKVGRILQTGFLQQIGRIGVTLYFPFPSIDLCTSNSTPPWDNSYIFTPLVANLVNEPPYYRVANSNNTENSIEWVKAQSLFSDNINIFFRRNAVEQDLIRICLLNQNGQILVEKKMRPDVENVSISTNNLPIGMYLLRIESPKNTKCLKVFKFD